MHTNTNTPQLNIKSQQSFIQRTSQLLTELSCTFDLVIKHTHDLKERQQLTDRISTLKRQLQTLKSRLVKDHNLVQAVKNFNRIYLQCAQLQSEVEVKQTNSMWNKENRRRPGPVNRQQKYQQAMEQLLERDGRIKEMERQIQNMSCEVNSLVGCREDLMKQNQHYRGVNARLEADYSQGLMEMKDLREKLDYYQEISQQSLKKLDIALQSSSQTDKQNRLLLQKGAAQIQRLSSQRDQLQTRCIRYQHMIQQRQNQFCRLNRLIYDKDQHIKHLQLQLQQKIFAVESKECQAKAYSQRMVLAEQNLKEVRRDYEGMCERYEGVRRELRREEELVVRKAKELEMGLEELKAEYEEKGRRREVEVGEMGRELQRLREELRVGKQSEEALQATSLYWQDECSRAKDQARSSSQQITCLHLQIHRITQQHRSTTCQKDLQLHTLSQSLQSSLTKTHQLSELTTHLQSSVTQSSLTHAHLLEQKNKYLSEFLAEQSIRKATQTSLRGMESEVVALKQQAKMDAREISNLSNILAGSEKEVIELKGSLQEGRIREKVLESQLREVQEGNQKMRVELSIKGDEITSLKEKSKVLEGEVRNLRVLESQVRKKTQDIGGYQQELNKKQQKLKQLHKQILNQNNYIKTLQQKTHNLSSRIHQLQSLSHTTQTTSQLTCKKWQSRFQQQLTLTSTLHSQLQTALQQSDISRQQLSSYRHQTQQQILHLNTMISQLHSRVQQLDECVLENKYYKQQQEILNKYVREFREEYGELQRRYEEANREYQRRVGELQLEIERLQERDSCEVSRVVVRENRLKVLKDIRRLMLD